MQITDDEMRDIAVCHEGVRLVCLYGGQPIGKQIDALKRRPQIVVATPGRLSDHMKRRTVNLKSVQTVVLDEADRMLDMGFIHDVTRILDKIPSRKNLGMFSATISREVMDISWVYQRDPEEITVQATKENKPDILQYRLEVPSDGKVDAIAKILAHENYDRVICFCNTKGSTERLTKFCRCGRGRPVHPQGTSQQAGRRSCSGSGTESCGCSWLRTWPAGASTWTMLDAVFSCRCRRKTCIHRIGRTGRYKEHGVSVHAAQRLPQPAAAGQHRAEHAEHHRARRAGRGRQRDCRRKMRKERTSAGGSFFTERQQVGAVGLRRVAISRGVWYNIHI